jgi:hypothetical protein
MPLEPAEVYARYAKLFETAERMEVRRPGSRAERERILLVDYDSTQSKPDMQEALTALTANGEVVSKTVSFREMAMPGHSIDEDRETERQNVRTALQTYDPSVIFLFGGDTGDYQPVLQWAQSQHAAVIYFLDLPAPALVADGELPEVAAKWELLHGADVVFVPTEDQKVRLERTFPKLKTIAVPAAQQVSQNEQSAPELRKDLLRLIAVGRATAGSKARQAQKEVQVCHSR